MPSTLTGYRYLALLMQGGITSGDLETELSGSTARKADFMRLLFNTTHRNNLLKCGYATIAASSSALTLVLTRGYVQDGLLRGLRFVDETSFLQATSQARAAGACTSAPKYSSAFVANYGTGSAAVDKFSFYTNAMAASGASVATAKANSAAGQSTDTGYLMGGDTGSGVWVATIDSINFPSDSVEALSAVLADSRESLAGVSSSTAAYACGGVDAVAGKTEIDGITFATHVAYNPSVALGTGRSQHAASESATKGYLAGGQDSSGSGSLATIEPLTFSGETIANLGSSLSAARRSLGSHRSATASFFLGGNGGTTTITKLTHSGETLSNLSAGLGQGSSTFNGNCGFQGGGA